jgi:hypothetical protein
MHNTLTSLFFSFPALLEFGNPAVSQNPARWLSMSAPGSQVADGGEDACLPSVAERSPCSAPSRDPMFFCARWSRSIPWSNWSKPTPTAWPAGHPPPCQLHRAAKGPAAAEAAPRLRVAWLGAARPGRACAGSLRKSVPCHFDVGPWAFLLASLVRRDQVREVARGTRNAGLMRCEA